MQAKGQQAEQYRAYLVRCWQEKPEPEGASIWRFSLLRVGSSDARSGFATLEDLFAALADELNIRPYGNRLRPRAAEHFAEHRSAYPPDYTLDSG